MRKFGSILRMDLENIIKNPVLIGYNTVFAFLSIWIMGLLTGGNYANSADAYRYYVVTMIIYGMLNGAMTASNIFIGAGYPAAKPADHLFAGGQLSNLFFEGAFLVFVRLCRAFARARRGLPAVSRVAGNTPDLLLAADGAGGVRRSRAGARCFAACCIARSRPARF